MVLARSRGRKESSFVLLLVFVTNPSSPRFLNFFSLYAPAASFTHFQRQYVASASLTKVLSACCSAEINCDKRLES